ncbi:uncharacterized protein LOC108510661 [Phoenix dactylifera]|uniref:Uncharacterized protein LOC108510661 n=1 Tax=Phoenix dactylifera TaxID=42345 RepID=A0A8B7MX91_PHODC|nr:uncharacterized protein LOC108510661 [Phoenix dactylifera]
MEGFRSRGHNDGRMQLGAYGGRPPPPPSGVYDLRSYSASSASSAHPGSGYAGYGTREVKLGKGKAASGSSKKGWVFSDPEFQRKKRVASYKLYAVEGRVKGSLRRSFRWLKDRYTLVVNGWW